MPPIRLLVAVAAIAAGCMDFGGFDTPTVEGTQWQAVSIAGQPPVPGKAPTLKLGPGSVTGSAGCNGYGSTSLTIDGDRIFMPGLAMSAALCLDDRLMEIELAFFQALQAANHLEFRDGWLVLSGVQGELIFEQVQTDPP